MSALAMEPGSPLAGKTVLLMEDDPVIGIDVSLTLEDAGALVVGPVARVADGLTRLDDGMPDIAVLDVELADGEVFPIVERLRAAGVPFVFYTGRASEGHMAARAEGAPLIPKAFGSHVVVEWLASLAA